MRHPLVVAERSLELFLGSLLMDDMVHVRYRKKEGRHQDDDLRRVAPGLDEEVYQACPVYELLEDWRP